MHVRLRLHDQALAACIERFVAEGTAASADTATKLCALVSFLKTLEGQFNLTLPIEDLRTATIDDARAAAAAGHYADRDRRFTETASYLLEMIVVRAHLWQLGLVNAAVDPHSHLSEIPWKHGLSALALYTDNPLTRYFTVWWIGPSAEVEQVLENSDISGILLSA